MFRINILLIAATILPLVGAAPATQPAVTIVKFPAYPMDLERYNVVDKDRPIDILLPVKPKTAKGPEEAP